MNGAVSVDWIDRAYVRLTGRGSFFQDGWGASGRLEELAARPFSPDALPVPIRWSAVRRHRGWNEQDGELESPLARELPSASRVAHARLLLPQGGAARGVCLVLGGTGDVGYGRRTRFVQPLLARGMGALLLENPFYGPRRPPGQRGVELRSVLDLLLLGRAAVEEARVLAAWLRAEGHDVVLTGYSMGGQLAAMAAALLPFDVAAVPAASPSSATAVFVDGLLSRATAWSALAPSPDLASERLAGLLDRVSLASMPAPRRPGAAIVLGARRDGYVARRHVESLHRHWAGAELRWMTGGHVSGYLAGGGVMRRAIVDALDRLRASP